MLLKKLIIGNHEHTQLSAIRRPLVERSKWADRRSDLKNRSQRMVISYTHASSRHTSVR